MAFKIYRIEKKTRLWKTSDISLLSILIQDRYLQILDQPLRMYSLVSVINSIVIIQSIVLVL